MIQVNFEVIWMMRKWHFYQVCSLLFFLYIFFLCCFLPGRKSTTCNDINVLGKKFLLKIKKKANYSLNTSVEFHSNILENVKAPETEPFSMDNVCTEKLWFGAKYDPRDPDVLKFTYIALYGTFSIVHGGNTGWNEKSTRGVMFHQIFV